MRYKVSELLYKALLIMLILDASINATTLSAIFSDKIHDMCLLIALLLAILCILSRKYKLKFLILNCVLLLFALLSYMISGNSDIFTSILLILLAWKIDLDDILKIIFKVRLTVFILVVLMSLVGILEVGTIATSSADKGILFGYGHANTFGGSVGILIFLMFAINRKKIKNIHFFIAILADILCFYFSRCRTALVLITLIIILLLMVRAFKTLELKMLKISLIVLPLLLLTLYILVELRSKDLAPQFVDFFDNIMNGRITLSCMNLKYYPATLMGQKVDISIIALQNRYYALDNAFIYILIHYGIIGIAVIGGLQQWSIMHCVKMQESVLCIICMIILCWMMYEGMMISVTTNFTLLFSTALIKNNYQEEAKA